MAEMTPEKDIAVAYVKLMKRFTKLRVCFQELREACDKLRHERKHYGRPTDSMWVEWKKAVEKSPMDGESS